ncbi:MAG: STAS domain-containing protein [Spirochaetes bacterium]|nr:STAS domain-containing protein [Spirochaetota bacterium]
MENLRGSIPSLIRTLTTENDHHVIIDMKNVKFIDSSFLGHMISLDKKLKVCGNFLVFFNIQSSVMELLIVSRLHKFFKIGNNLTEAIAELKLP